MKSISLYGPQIVIMERVGGVVMVVFLQRDKLGRILDMVNGQPLRHLQSKYGFLFQDFWIQ